MAVLAVRVGDTAAMRANEVMMVVADAPLEAGGMADRLDLAHEFSLDACREHVVHRLSGKRTQLFEHPLMHKQLVMVNSL